MILLPGLWAINAAPLARTEPHRALPAQAMVQGEGWLVPTLYGRPYLLKPPMQYWLLAASQQATGSRAEWVYRVPSVLCSACLGLIVWGMTRRWFGRTAGLAAGCAYLALIALWAQSRSADVDALNTLATAAAALFMIEFSCGERRRAWPWLLPVALASAVATMTKGPAGLPVLLAAAAVPALVNRGRARLRAVPLLIVLLLALAVFGAWLGAARHAIQEAGLTMDWTGAREVRRNLFEMTGARTLAALLVPVQLCLYALPMSIALPLAWRSATFGDRDPDRQRLARTVVAVCGVAILIGLIARVANPRYMYIVLPLFCPAAGVVMQAWLAGAYGARLQRFLRQVMTVTTFALCTIGAAIAIHRWQAVSPALLVVVTGAMVLVGAWTIRQWVAQRVIPGAWGIVALLPLLVILHAEHQNAMRRRVCSYNAAVELSKIVGEGATVAAGRWVLGGPEMFMYAGVKVDFPAEHLASLKALPADRWIVFHPEEWDVWRKRRPCLVEHMILLPTNNTKAMLSRCDQFKD